MVEKNVREWGFKEGVNFDGLVPAEMELLGEEFCVGNSNVIVSMLDEKPNGHDALKVVSPVDVINQ